MYYIDPLSEVGGFPRDAAQPSQLREAAGDRSGQNPGILCGFWSVKNGGVNQLNHEKTDGLTMENPSK